MKYKKPSVNGGETVPSAPAHTLLALEQSAQVMHMSQYQHCDRMRQIDTPKTGCLASSEEDVSVGQALFTRPEAAKIAGISISTLDRLVKAGQVPYKRIRGRVLFPKGRFIAWCSTDQMWIGSMGVAA